ncbi:Peptidase, family S49 [hydrothermal vent metagenome]|uniref:Peptidase, family S49 n=1 Tax=hydrothermal vent metagenome TaxID=652676 RepID=A0A3B0TIB5_9ZZZZ
MNDDTQNSFMAKLGSAWDRLNEKIGPKNAVIPVVRLHGVISAEQKPNRINIEAVNPLLEKAFETKRAPAVAIVINSPGGSPVQSRLVGNRIRELADKHDKKVLVFIEDVAASGGYFISVVADEIFADPSSIVGSIGVIMAGFGFEEAIAKIGVTRRIYTAGKSKSTLDPFLPEKKADVERIKGFESDIHKVFIDYVKQHRGEKLIGKDEELFTGEWWPAVRGIDLGLVDAIGDMHTVLRERFGDDVKLKPLKTKRGMFSMPNFGMSANISQGLGADIISAVEERSLWSRFGL